MEKRSITYLAILGIIIGFFAGWGITAVLTPPGGTQRYTIVVTGSTTVEPIMTVAADQFMDLNPNVQISVVASGSGAGIADTIAGLNDIGMSSRNIKSTENDTTGGTLIDYQIAKDGLTAIVASTSTDVDTALTMEELFLIYNGTYTYWDDGTLDGNHVLINVYTRADGSGTRATFEELVLSTSSGLELGVDTGYQDNVSSYIEVSSNTVMVTQVGGDNQGIGYCGLGYVDTTVTKIAIDGVIASEATVLDGTYPISRALHLVTNGQPTAIVQAFIDYIYGPAGQAVVGAEGFIRIWS